MLGAQSVPRSTDTRAEATAPLADSIIHDRLDKASPLVYQTHIRFVDVSYSGSVNFLMHSRCYSRLGSNPMNSAATLLEKRSLAPFDPGKRRCCVLDAPVHRPVERQNPTPGYPEYGWQWLLGKKIVAIVGLCPIHFDTRLDKMDVSAAINKLLFKRIGLRKNLALLCLTRYCDNMSEVRWKMFI